MESTNNKILYESVKRLLRRNAIPNLKKIVKKTHAADLSTLFNSLTPTQQLTLFGLISDVEEKGLLFSYLEAPILLGLIQGIDLGELVTILDNMPTDDATDLIGRMPQDLADQVLSMMRTEGSAEIEDLLRYDDDTAGGIMVNEYIAFKENLTAGEAIKLIQKDFQDVEMPFYLYVVDEYGKLVGVCSLRQLVVVQPVKKLCEFMTTDVFSVNTDVDQEEVAKIVARYDILAVPVVDHHNCLVGIVTVDDVIDIFRKEATEDFLKMAGVGEEFVETQSVVRSTRTRLPWLFASCLGGILAFFIIGHFEESLSRLTYLAAFIPVIMGMGGNIGTQSSTIVVRGLATGRLNKSDLWQVVSKELAVGLALGIFYGVVIGIVARTSYPVMAFAVSVGIGVLLSMTIAALVGSFVPMVFARVDIDPAVATGPFVTTAVDIISVYLYFHIATTLLQI